MNKHIVIIGGMGPQASLELHCRIIEGAVRSGVRRGADFPEILHASLPIDDFITDQAKVKRALAIIVHALERLYLWREGRGYNCV